MPRPEQRRSNIGRSVELQRRVLLPSITVSPQRGEEIGSELLRKVGGKEFQDVVVVVVASEVVARAFSEEGAEARQDLRDK